MKLKFFVSALTQAQETIVLLNSSNINFYIEQSLFARTDNLTIIRK